jgi:DNA-directed RNA polymerase subunit RPC12/RpoP
MALNIEFCAVCGKEIPFLECIYIGNGFICPDCYKEGSI